MKKFLSVLFATVMTATLFVGCGGNEDKKQPEGGTAGKTQLNFVLWDYKEGTYDYAMVKAFEEKHDKYEVKVTSSPSKDYETKLTTMISGGGDVDVFLGKSNTVYPQLVDKGFGKDITDKVKAEIDLDKFGTVLKSQYELDGKYYGLPYRTNDWVLYYNKKIFDDKGVAYPSNDMTWEQVRDLAKQVTSGEGVDKIYGIGFQPKPGFILPMMISNIPDFKVYESDLSGLIKPLEYFNALQYDDKVLQEYSESKSMSQDQTYFFKGQIAMYYNGSWFGQMLSDADLDFDWGIAKGPYWEGGEKAVFVTSTPVMISTEAKNEEGAFELLKFYVGEEGAKIMAEKKMIPSFQSDEVMKIYKDTLKLDDSSFEAVTNNKTYDFGPAHIKSGEISKAMNQELELFITKNQDAQTTVDNMTARRQEILGQN